MSAVVEGPKDRVQVALRMDKGVGKGKGMWDVIVWSGLPPYWTRERDEKQL